MNLDTIFKGALIASMAATVTACSEGEYATKPKLAPDQKVAMSEPDHRLETTKPVRIIAKGQKIEVEGYTSSSMVTIYPKELVGTQRDLVCVDRSGTSCNWDLANKPPEAPKP